MKFLPSILILLLAGCAPESVRIPGPAKQVSRGEAIQIARTYQELQWTPSERNVLHGRDADGITVHTPDQSLGRYGHRNGWWQPNLPMTGMPYQWGGFDTPQEFLKCLNQGQAAGDVATPEKRRLDDAGTSHHACGIDCSGFISRCWRLDRHYSTDELHLICIPLESVNQLKPGDIMLNDRHVVLFCNWDPYRLNHLLIYESTPNPTWRVNLGSISLERLEGEGYRPWRYRHITD